MQKRTLVISSLGPIPWQSYQDIYPVLEEAFEKAGFEVFKTLMPVFKPDRVLLKKWGDSERIVLPLGVEHFDSLDLVSMIRNDYGIKTPITVMVAADLTKGYSRLFEYTNLFKNGDTFVTNCTPEKEILHLVFGQKIHVDVIPLPVAESWFEINLPKLKTKMTTKKFIYAGRISAQKNIHNLLALMKRIREKHDVHLDLYGMIDNIGVPHFKHYNLLPYHKQLATLVERFDLKNSISFKGHLNQSDLQKVFKEYDAFISTTLHSGEDYGYAVAQALAAGLPTFVTHWGGGVDFTRNYGANKLPVYLNKNGLYVDIESSKNVIKAFLNSENPGFQSKQLGVEAVSKKWALISDDSYKSLSCELKVEEKFLRKYKELCFKKANDPLSNVYFENPDDPLYREICECYGSVLKKTQIQISEHPCFIKESGAVYDPLHIA